MLTGDKLETAICILISSGLKKTLENLYIIKDIQTTLELEKEINDYKHKF